VIIPEHDVITRRKQFRMKKDRKEARTQKKLKKKAEADDKKKLKEEKKRARDAKKLDKEKKKHDREDKKKEKEAAKAGAKKHQPGSKSQKYTPSAKETAKEGMDADGEDMIPTTHETPSMMNEEVPVSPADIAMTKSPSKTPVKKTRSSRLRRLRKFEAVAKSATGGANSPKNTGRKKKGGKGKKKMCKNDGGNKRKEEELDLDTPPAKKKKVSNPAKGKTSKKNKPPVLPQDEIKEHVSKVLHECRDSGCTHPSFKHPDLCKKTYELSIYWNRKAVGVKLSKDYLPWKKPAKTGKNGKHKSQSKSQVAYFACDTSCMYSNLLLAGLYVTCMHLCMQAGSLL
jgi:hypothetical protein